MRQELDEVKNYPRTNLTNLTASYWEYYGGRASFEYWANQANRMIFEYRLDSNPPQAARVYALMDVAFYDSFVACWDAKYTYWAARPAMLDPEIKTVFVTPNHPSYPSAHGCLSSAAGTVMASLFPREAGYYTALVAEVSEARITGADLPTFSTCPCRAPIASSRSCGTVSPRASMSTFTRSSRATAPSTFRRGALA